MTDGVRGILIDLTGDVGTLDGLLAWCRFQGWRVVVELGYARSPIAYWAAVSRRAGSRTRTIGNGDGPTGFDALGIAVVVALARDRLCDECWGRGGFGERVCAVCNGTGLGTPAGGEDAT